MNELKMTCRRCRGTGMTGHVVVYNGAPGTCYACAGAGEVYKDKFHRAFGVGQRFVGVTERVWLNEGNPNNGIFKSVATVKSLNELEGLEQHIASGEFVASWGGSSRFVEITEAQAREFVQQFGYNVRARRGDSVPEHNFSRAERRACLAA